MDGAIVEAYGELGAIGGYVECGYFLGLARGMR
jgi:hypothetical protein